MSYLTNVILCTAKHDKGADLLSQWLVEQHGVGSGLQPVGFMADMECSVLLTAINYCDTDALLKRFKSCAWDDPDCAQLLIKQQDWLQFKSARVRD